MTRDNKNETQKFYAHMKTIRYIFETCLEYLERHERLTGAKMTAEEALVLMWIALFNHFYNNLAWGNAVVAAYSKMFRSRLVEILEGSPPELITTKLQEEYNLHCKEDNPNKGEMNDKG